MPRAPKGRQARAMTMVMAARPSQRGAVRPAAEVGAAWWGHHTYRDGSTRGTAVWFRLDWKPA